MAGRKKGELKAETVFNAVMAANGSYTAAAQALHTSVLTIDRILSLSPEHQAKLDMVHNVLMDKALKSAGYLLDTCDPNFTKYILSTVGARRGFKENSTVTLEGNPDKPIVQKADLSSLTTEQLLAARDVSRLILGKKKV